MTQENFFKSIEETYKTGLSLIKKKNADYATEFDPFKNFGFAQMVGVSLEKAILVRISDKLARISNLIDKPGQIKSEKIEDTLLDLCNYAAILKARLEDKNEI